MNYAVCALAGYLSGSVLYAYHLPLWLLGIDITEDTPDGNPGVFNCVSRAGWGIGLLAAVCEVAKGAVPVLLAASFLDIRQWPFALVLAAPVAGHAWPLLRPDRGGKGIAVSFGVLLGLFPVWQPVGILALCYLVFSLVVRVQPHRCRSIVTYLCFTAGMILRFRATPITLGSALVSAIVIKRHHRPPEGEGSPTVRVRLRRT